MLLESVEWVGGHRRLKYQVKNKWLQQLFGNTKRGSVILDTVNNAGTTDLYMFNKLFYRYDYVGYQVGRLCSVLK